MTYRIEITADSLDELAGRVLALAAQIQTTPAPVVVPAKATRKAAPEKVPEKVPEPAAVEETPVAEKVPEPEPAAVVEYDVQKDILPRVLRFVEMRGRDAVEALLAQFGVARASLVPVEQRGELVALLDEAIAG